jgi:hypothetical protein
MIEMAVGINLRRHIQGKPLYPVITNGDNALDPIKKEVERQLSFAEMKIQDAADICAEPQMVARHAMAADVALKYSQQLAVLRKITFLSNIDNGRSWLGEWKNVLKIS